MSPIIIEVCCSVKWPKGALNTIPIYSPQAKYVSSIISFVSQTVANILRHWNIFFQAMPLSDWYLVWARAWYIVCWFHQKDLPWRKDTGSSNYIKGIGIKERYRKYQHHSIEDGRFAYTDDALVLVARILIIRTSTGSKYPRSLYQCTVLNLGVFESWSLLCVWILVIIDVVTSCINILWMF